MIPVVEVDSIELEVTAGTITDDASQSPRFAGELTIAVPDDVTLDLLDPRVTPRVQITCASRTFDFTVRSRVPSQGDADVVLTVASDEALLADYAPLEDIDLISYAGDLSTLLEQVILEATGDVVSVGGDTANVTPYWALTNLIPNPQMTTNIANWGSGTGASALGRSTFGSTAALNWTAAAGTSNVIPATTLTAYRVTAGKTYVFEFDIRSTVARSARAAIQWRTGGGAITHTTEYGTVVVTSTSGFQRVFIIATAPEGADYCQPFVNTTGNASGNIHYVTNAMFYEGTRRVPYFSGATAASATYTYAWADPLQPNNSASVRTPLVDSPSPDALLWRAGQSGLEFIVPLAQAAGLRPVCDETRTWTLRGESYTTDGNISIRYGVNLIDGSDEISRDSRIWFDAAARIYTDPITQVRTVDTFALNDPHTLLSRVEIAAAFPGPGRAEYAVRRAQNRGREITAKAKANWAAAAEMSTTFILEGAPTQIGTAQSVEFDLDLDEMTVKAATADIPEGAWLLALDTQSWLAAPSTQSWLAAG